MVLIDIVKKLPWPDGRTYATQSGDCFVRFYAMNEPDLWFCNGAWNAPRGVDFICIGPNELADDYGITIITHADWLAAQEQVEPKEREPGFYWVLGMADWFVAEWDGELWSAPFNDNRFDDDGVFEIDERRIVRQP